MIESSIYHMKCQGCGDTVILAGFFYDYWVRGHIRCGARINVSADGPGAKEVCEEVAALIAGVRNEMDAELRTN